jgi:hypothetical protein
MDKVVMAFYTGGGADVGYMILCVAFAQLTITLAFSATNGSADSHSIPRTP